MLLDGDIKIGCSLLRLAKKPMIVIGIINAEIYIYDVWGKAEYILFDNELTCHSSYSFAQDDISLF